jgi:hypothetical protein
VPGGPLLGRGLLEGTCIERAGTGSGRRLEGTMRGGGGISWEGADTFCSGMDGGAIGSCFLAEALWAEFKAGNEGGGRSSSSSSSSEPPLLSSENDGIGTLFGALSGTALGVDCGEGIGSGSDLIKGVDSRVGWA